MRSLDQRDGLIVCAFGELHADQVGAPRSCVQDGSRFFRCHEDAGLNRQQCATANRGRTG